MKFLLLPLFIFASLFASDWNSFTYYPEMDHFYHPVSTDCQEAQDAFNEGLFAHYAFNSTQAFESFKKAASLDPDLAMAYWGMALTMRKQPQKKQEAQALIEKAKGLSDKVTDNEKQYISALWIKFNQDSQDYKAAMQKVVEKYPDDVDARTLYAESMMDLMKWTPWTYDKKPKEFTEETLYQLKMALKSDPNHPGANHYFIHATEGSKNPEDALESADRLNRRYPQWGHLLHTPTHIYIRVGDYEKSIHCNLRGIAADKEFIKKHGIDNRYIFKFYLHNVGFLSRCYLWSEQYEKALETAIEVQEFSKKLPNKIPDDPEDLLLVLQTYLYFHKWHEVIESQEPEIDFVKTFWHFAKAESYLSLNQMDEAEKERKLFHEGQQAGLGDIFTLASLELDAFFEKAKGNVEGSIELFKKAVEKLDHMFFMKWHYQERQLLGKALLQANRPQEAEKAFREALLNMQRNGRSLFGLNEALKAQNKFNYWTERETREALKDYKTFSINDL